MFKCLWFNHDLRELISMKVCNRLEYTFYPGTIKVAGRTSVKQIEESKVLVKYPICYWDECVCDMIRVRAIV